MTKRAIIKVRNTKDYIYKPEVVVAGKKKDFFENDDAAFARHKNDLVLATSIIAQDVSRRKITDFATIKINLKEEAIAKSHRPTHALFNDKYPVIGAKEIGEIFVQVTPGSLPNLAERISQAKVNTEYKLNKKGEIEAKVSALRSEVGAIDKISLYQPQDKVTQGNKDVVIQEIFLRREVVVELFRLAKNTYISDEQISILHKNLIESVCGVDESIKVINDSRFYDDVLHISMPLLSESKLRLVLELLVENPLVKEFYPSPIIDIRQSEVSLDGKFIEYPLFDAGTSYPKVALIDSGIRNKQLKPWVVYSSDAFYSELNSNYHADEMASILLASSKLNKLSELEEDGCNIYDICLPPTPEAFNAEFKNIEAFSDWLFLEARAAREEGFRIFSMSLNLTNPISDCRYSLLASKIDDISKSLGVIFVISAGNLDPKQYRPEWPSNHNDIFKMLARFKYNDRLLEPADSVMSITVGSINHTQNQIVTNQAPARYTRRGPSLSYGIKPDLVHFGGIGDHSNSGMFTVDGQGNILSNSHGTSLSVPHVAKTLAKLDLSSGENLDILTLKSLLLHNCKIPKCIDHKDIENEARSFVGFGFPEKSSDIINREENSFTFIFEDKLQRGQIAEFLFQWPASLTTPTGKCKGKVRMTLVYDTPIDRHYGQEYIRANVDASLQQEKIKSDQISFKKEVHSIWDTKLGDQPNFEKGLITHGFKWWPCKVYERFSKNGFGNSINWRLQVSSQVRDGVTYPDDGIKFSVVITLEDISMKSNTVYREMYQSFVSIGVDVINVNVRDEVKVQ